jgi:hypothetical protein
MQRDATKASVTLPPKDSTGQSYSFSFAAQSKSLAYAPGSLAPLAVQLADIKALCNVLVQAKVNSLDNIRRERVSDDDLKGPQTDYLTEKSVTNELAVLTPYEVSFRCFSSELASVLAGFAASPCGLLVKTINVESAPAAAAGTEAFAPAATATPYAPPVRSPAAGPSAAERYAERYGLRGRGAAGAGASERYGLRGPPVPAAQPAYVPPAAPASRGGLPISLDERQLKVTLMLYAVKPVASK